MRLNSTHTTLFSLCLLVSIIFPTLSSACTPLFKRFTTARLSHSRTARCLPQMAHTETDKWIECLLGCKALSEVEVRALCEKVSRCSPRSAA